MELEKFTNKIKSSLKPKFKQYENISITEEFQNKPFQSNNNEVQITLISAECLKFSCSFFEFSRLFMLYRGGVEDTRLEAKAKDTKKNPRPRTAFPRTDTLEAKNRNARGQGQGPRTQAQVLSKKKTSSQKFFRRSQKKKKKRSSQKFFKRSPQKNVFQKIFQPLHKILTIQKIVLSSSRGLEASRPKPRLRTSKCVLEDVLEAKDVLEDSSSDAIYTVYEVVRLETLVKL